MTVSPRHLYLASQSPRRRELLHQIGVSHDVLSVSVVERRRDGETPRDYVARLAREKSAAGWRALLSQGLPRRPVLGADTLGELDGEVLEKPRDRDHAVAMLLAMAGRRHRVLTAVALTSERGQECEVVTAEVTFGAISEARASAYWDTGEPCDKAGSYAIQGLGAVFVEHLSGSYSAVVGLPLYQTAALLQRHGVPIWNLQAEGNSA